MPLEPPPIPIAAVYGAAPKPHVTVTFDRLLRPGVLDEDNWWFRENNQDYSGDTAVAAGTDVVVEGSLIGANFGADVIDYTPPPFDVISDFGKLAAAFADFPTT